jgi:hypothetical protein
MKKYQIAAITAILLMFPVMTYAVGQGSTQGAKQGSTDETSETIVPTKKIIVTPTGVANQNKVETQNQGEESQIQTQEMEQEENEGTNGGQFGENRNQNAYEHMSTVAQKVQSLQMLGDREGGLGEQIREIARTQNESQDKIQTELGKLDERQGWLKSLIGPDFSAVKNIKMELEQNRVRMQQLEKLQNELFNQGDVTTIKEMTQALIAENEALQNKLTQEEGTKSMFGWLFRFLAK